MLFYKLQRLGVAGNFYSLLKEMYNECQYCIKTSSGISEPFLSTSGVKQGWNLSPTLANIYQNDLHEIFDEPCAPVNLADMPISSMSWTDDLVLLSESAEGLHGSLDKFREHCYKWGLQVNKAKTKCMVLRKCGTRNPLGAAEIKYGETNLEFTDSTRYLGLQISAKGDLSHTIKDRVEKANRAANMCEQALRTTGNVSAAVSLKILDHQILPVLTYGCCIWGAPRANRTVLVTNIPASIINLSRHVRDYINTKCQKEINTISVKRNTRGTPAVSEPQQTASVTFSSLWDKDLFLSLCNPMDTYKAKRIPSSRDTPAKIYERTHSNYCKGVRVLNVSKYASTQACLFELGRTPVENHIHHLMTKYWLRLEHGTKNHLQNKAYMCAKSENHDWFENVKYFLYTNGFGYAWECSSSINKKSLFKDRQTVFRRSSPSVNNFKCQPKLSFSDAIKINKRKPQPQLVYRLYQ